MTRQFRPHFLGLATLLLILPLVAVATAPLQVIGLEEALQLGRDESPSLRQAQERLCLAGEGVLASYGSFLPSLSTSAGYGHNYLGPQSGTGYFDPNTQQFFDLGSSSTDYESYSFRLSGGWTLFAGGANWAGLKASKWERDATGLELEAALRETDRSIIQAFYGLYRSQKLAEVAVHSLVASRASFEQVRRAFMMGAVARSDTLQASVNVGEVRLTLLETQNARDIARVNLATLLGMDVRTPLVVEEVEFPDFIVLDRDAIFAAAHGSNPDLGATEARLLAAGANLRQAKAALWPSLQAGYSYSWSDRKAPDGIGAIFDKDYSYSVSLGLNLNLFDGFRTRQSISSARVGRRLAEYGLDLQERALIQTLESLLVTLENSRKRVELARATLELAREELRQSRERYRVGATTLLEVTDAEVSVRRARSSEIDGMTSYLLALADLERNTGLSLKGAQP